MRGWIREFGMAARAPGAFARLLAHPSFRWGFLLFAIVVGCAVFAYWLAPHDPFRNNFRDPQRRGIDEFAPGSNY